MVRVAADIDELSLVSCKFRGGHRGGIRAQLLDGQIQQKEELEDADADEEGDSQEVSQKLPP